MELFNSALQGKIMLMYEYFLVGSVYDSYKDGFLEILRGLCDNPENRPTEFMETEYSFSTVNVNNAKISLKARSTRNLQDGFCHLRYVGNSDLKTDREKKAMVRTYIDCLTSANLNEYLSILGFKYNSFSGFIFW